MLGATKLGKLMSTMVVRQSSEQNQGCVRANQLFGISATITVWLKANQSVCTREMSVICVLCDGKGISFKPFLLSSYHPDLFVRNDPREEKES